MTFYADKLKGWQKEMESDFDILNSELVLLYAAVLALLLGKNLTTESYTYWVRVRFAGAAAKLGVVDKIDRLLAKFPQVEVCQKIYSRMASLWTVRSGMVWSFICVAKGRSNLARITSWINQMLAWSEATHLYTVLTQIVIKHIRRP